MNKWLTKIHGRNYKKKTFNLQNVFRHTQNP